MTTLSGTADFQLTRNELITAVLQNLHVLDRGTASASAADITLLSRILNMLVKNYAVKGLNLWTYQRIVLPLSMAFTNYLLGPDGGMVIGATIDSGGSGYGAPPSVTFSAPSGGGVTATGTAVLTGGVVTSINLTAAGSKYTTRPTITFGSGAAVATARLNGIFTTRPLKVLNARSRSTQGSEVDMNRLGRREYDGMSMKSTAGQVPVQYYYDPQLDNGILYLFPTPNSNTAYDVRLTVQRPLQDVNLSTENVDIPQEWFLPIMWDLCNEASLIYGCPMDVVKHIREMAMAHGAMVSDWDGGQDHTNIIFDVYPDHNG